MKTAKEMLDEAEDDGFITPELREYTLRLESQLEATHRTFQYTALALERTIRMHDELEAKYKGLFRSRNELSGVIKTAYNKIHGLQFHIQLLEQMMQDHYACAACKNSGNNCLYRCPNDGEV